MKAAQINKYGNSGIVEINNDAPAPSLQEDQILVEVYNASINPVDKALREGYLQNMLALPFPITLGGDFSGVVTKVGPDVSDFKSNDEVYGQASALNGGSGSFAELTVANVVNTALKPKTVNFEQAAAMPLVGASAIQAIEEHLDVKEGEKILIHGGAGGIGSLAIQLAKLRGAFVAATTSKDTAEFVKNLGANQVIDYQNEKFEELVTNFDAVFDTVGGDVTNKSLRVLKRGGKLVSMIGQPDQELAGKYGVTALTQMTGATSGRLKSLAQLIDAGKIKPQLDKTYSLDRVKEGFDYFEKEHQKGKIVIKIR